MELSEKNVSESNQCFKILDGHDAAVYATCLWRSVNYGNILITGSQDSTVRLWNVDNSMCVNTLRGHEKDVVCVTASPNNCLDPLIASGSTDAKIFLWSLLSGKKVRVLEGHKSVVTGVALVLDPSPLLISSGSDSDIVCWNLNDGSIIRRLACHVGPVSSLVTACVRIPVIVSGGDDKVIRVWDMRSGALIKSLAGHESEINVVAVSSDQSNPIIVSGAADGSIFVWDLLGLQLIFPLQSASEDHIGGKSEVSSISITNGIFPLIVVSTWTSSIHVWDSKSGGLLCVLAGAHVKRVCTVACGSDETGPIFISGGYDANVAIWSPFEDLVSKVHVGASRYPNIEDVSLEQSLVLAGKYLCCWNLVNENGITDDDCAVFSNMNIMILVFYSLIRMGHINPRMVRVKAMALSYVMSKAIEHIDLLFHDSLFGNTPLHFLLQNRLCLQYSQRWMAIESNINKVINSLANPLLSSETLDSILRGVVCNDDDMTGWEVLLPNSSFTEILSNLMLQSKKSHNCIAVMLKNFGIEPATEPFPVPLTILNHKTKNVVRWNENVTQGKGYYYYRLKANSFLNTEYLLSAEFFALLADSSEVDNFVSAPLVKYLIQYKWEKWGIHVTKNLFAFYVVYLFTTTYSVIAICTGEFVDFNSHFSYILFIIFSILCNACLMALAFWQCLLTGSYNSYLRNYWNLTDVVMLLLCHFSIILGAMFGPTDAVRILSTIYTLLLWGRILYFGRGIEDLAGIVHIMKLIIWDVRYFMLILILFLCAYAISFRVLGIYDSLWLSFFRLFNMMIGDVFFEHSVKGYFVPSLLYLTFLVCVAIILLNALIAFMDNSFRIATDTKNTAVLVSRLKLLTELEIKCLPFVSMFGGRKEEKDLGGLVILLLESEWNLSELEEQASPMLRSNMRNLAKLEGSHAEHHYPSRNSKLVDHHDDASGVDWLGKSQIREPIFELGELLEKRMRVIEEKLDFVADTLFKINLVSKGERHEYKDNVYRDSAASEGTASYSYFEDDRHHQASDS